MIVIMDSEAQEQDVFEGLSLNETVSIVQAARSFKWNQLFEKYSNDTSQNESIEFAEVQEYLDFDEDSDDTHSNPRPISNFTEEKKQYIQNVVDNCAPNFRNILLQREKAKILLNSEDYKPLNEQFYKYMGLLRKELSEKDLIFWCQQCAQPQEDIRNFISLTVFNYFKERLIKQRSTSLQSRNYEKRLNKLTKIWEAIARYFSEDELVATTLQLLKQYNLRNSVEE